MCPLVTGNEGFVAGLVGAMTVGLNGFKKRLLVREILVAAEHHLEVVQLVLLDPQARNVVRVASVTEIAEVEVIEKNPFVVEGLIVTV